MMSFRTKILVDKLLGNIKFSSGMEHRCTSRKSAKISNFQTRRVLFFLAFRDFYDFSVVQTAKLQKSSTFVQKFFIQQ